MTSNNTTWPVEFTFKAPAPKNDYDAAADRELAAVLGTAGQAPHKFRIGPLCQAVPRPTDEEYQRLKESIKSGGLGNPTIVLDDDTGEVLDGWSRLRIAHELGLGLEKLKIVTLSSLPQLARDTFKGRSREFVLLASERRSLTIKQRIHMAEAMFKAEGKRRATQQDMQLLRVKSPKAPPRDSVYTREDIAAVAKTDKGHTDIPGAKSNVAEQLQTAFDALNAEGRLPNPGPPRTAQSRYVDKARYFTSRELAQRASCSKAVAANFLVRVRTSSTTGKQDKEPPASALDFAAYPYLKGKTDDELRDLHKALGAYLKTRTSCLH